MSFLRQKICHRLKISVDLRPIETVPEYVSQRKKKKRKRKKHFVLVPKFRFFTLITLCFTICNILRMSDRRKNSENAEFAEANLNDFIDGFLNTCL